MSEQFEEHDNDKGRDGHTVASKTKMVNLRSWYGVK